MKWLVPAIALLSGAALAVQVGMNNGLRAKVGHPVVAAWLSFAIGTTAITLFLIATAPTRCKCRPILTRR